MMFATFANKLLTAIRSRAIRQSIAHMTRGDTYRYSAIVITVFLMSSVQAQTPTLERLKEALALERQSDLPAAEGIYRSLVNDPDWAAAARLSLARVQRWQSIHAEAVANYEAVLNHPQATAGMRDEANVGLAQIDALEMRLVQALRRLDRIASTSSISEQINQIRAKVIATTPTRLGASYGEIHNKDGSTDSSWQLRLTHQLDMRNTIAGAYSSNSLQQRSTQPDAALDFVKGQWLATWSHRVPLGPSYKLDLTHRRLNVGSQEISLRAQAAWPLGKSWGGTVSFQRDVGAASSTSSGSLGISTKASQNTQIGATVFAGETPTGTLYSWMLNSTWERGPWLAQWFIARSLDHSPVSNTIVMRERLSSGPTWRVEIKKDRNGNSAFLGLDVPWGPHVVSASVNRYPAATQWTTGFDYAWPNRLAKANTAQP